MRTDHLTFRRATSISLIGLSLQLVFALALLLYTIFAVDWSALTASIYIGCGVIIWLGLALAFHQHKLERLEAVEAEAFSAAGGEQSSVFESAGEDLRVQSRRLAWMHRVLLPILSLIYGGLLLGLGVWRFTIGKKVLTDDLWRPPQEFGWAIALGLGAAAVGFVFARFVAGMAKQTVWANPRAGAAASVGIAVVGLALAVANFLAFLGNEIGARYFGVIAPGIMVVLGAEVFFNFVLNIYRPRRAGEVPRPAFDSRILGFLSAPDRLAKSVGEAVSYQFGFDVTTSWFYRLLSRTLLLLVGFGLIMLWALSSMAVVQPDRKGLILRFGALQREVASGLHFKWPWPVERLETYPALRVNEIQVATPPPTEQGSILWTSTHVKAGQEIYFLVQPVNTGQAAPATSGHGSTPGGPGSSGSDLALVSAEIPLHYTVRNLEQYERLAATNEMRDNLLRSVASRQAMEHLSSYSAEEILGTGRLDIARGLHQRIAKAFDALGAGVEVLFVGLVGVHPPQDEEVAKSFERVVLAEQQAEATVERARATAIRSRTAVAGDVALSSQIVAELDALERLNSAGAGADAVRAQQQKIDSLVGTAGGEAEVLVLRARADRWRRHMEERSRASRHSGLIAAFRASPNVFKAQTYLDTWADLAQDARVYLTAFPDGRIRMGLEDTPDVAGVPAPPKPKEQ